MNEPSYMGKARIAHASLLASDIRLSGAYWAMTAVVFCANFENPLAEILVRGGSALVAMCLGYLAHKNGKLIKEVEFILKGE